jgi:hypothetical protein
MSSLFRKYHIRGYLRLFGHFDLNSIKTCEVFNFLLKIWRFCETAREKYLFDIQTRLSDLPHLSLDEFKNFVYPFLENWFEVFAILL